MMHTSPWVHVYICTFMYKFIYLFYISKFFDVQPRLLYLISV